jgi:hypothetical protein
VKVVSKYKLVLLLVSYAMVHLVFHPGFTVNRQGICSISQKGNFALRGITPTSDRKVTFAIKYRRGIESSQENEFDHYGSFIGYVFNYDNSLGLFEATRRICALSDKLPGSLFSYYPCSLRSPPIC